MKIPKGAIVTNERPYNDLPPLEKERIAKWFFDQLHQDPRFKNIPDAFKVFTMLEVANPLVVEYTYKSVKKRKLRFSRELFYKNAKNRQLTVTQN